MTSVLVYTVHKAASTFLHRLAADVCSELTIPYYSIYDDAYQESILDDSWACLIESKGHTACCFGPIRPREKKGPLQSIVPANVGRYSIVLHVRDPRDVLTSLFFSHVYSHRNVQGGFDPSVEQRERWETEGIDRFVIDRIPDFQERYRQLLPLLNANNVVLLKYEDLVTRYDRWLHGFLQAFSHIEPASKTLFFDLIKIPRSRSDIYDSLLDKYRHEFAVQEEDVHRHKRQVTPGDYKRKLSSSTITTLNREFEVALALLGYDD